MAELNINLTKWWHYLIAAVSTLGPIIAFCGTAWMWLDTRYMHREISDTRYIELQMKIIEGHIRDYNRIVAGGGTPSPDDVMNYELDLDQLKNLQQERNRILGIGTGLPK